jgi:ribosomal protein S18 acetylase RimI-like enzyme
VAALVHLRSLMFASMGSEVGGQDAAWRVAAADWLREQLIRPQQFAGFVMEHPSDGVLRAALGSCDARAPSPNDLGGSHGHVLNICTEPAYRRSGYAHACLGALLTWLAPHAATGATLSARHGEAHGGSRIWGEAPCPQEEAPHSRA